MRVKGERFDHNRLLNHPFPSFSMLIFLRKIRHTVTNRHTVVIKSLYQVLLRSGIDRTNPTGVSWYLLENPPDVEFNQISVSPNAGRLWLASWDGRVFARTGMTKAERAGRAFRFIGFGISPSSPYVLLGLKILIFHCSAFCNSPHLEGLLFVPTFWSAVFSCMCIEFRSSLLL